MQVVSRATPHFPPAMTLPGSAGGDAFSARLASFSPTLDPAVALRALQGEGLADLPFPGRGATLVRWRALAEVGAHDQALAKLYEGHTDALATLAELGMQSRDGLWGTWAAEAPHARLHCTREPVATGEAQDVSGIDAVRLHGRKAWCSGAAGLTHALVTAWEGELGPLLVAVPLRQHGVEITGQGWDAVGMARSASVEVVFDGARGTLVGRAASYLHRPGFWHGGAGIAACWYGGALGLARVLRQACAQRADAHRLAHLGVVDARLAATAALLRECAAWIDAHPGADARAWALRVRASAESTATSTLDHVGRALGATPYCRDARFAALAADLPVFLRQSHAERDLASLGTDVAAQAGSAWTL